MSRLHSEEGLSAAAIDDHYLAGAVAHDSDDDDESAVRGAIEELASVRREAAQHRRAFVPPRSDASFEPFQASRVGSPIPDSHGLGWPGKGTLARLNSSPAQQQARTDKLAGAVRTLLECIGEDPDREGLARTPERYAKALLWMTKGYEERLPDVIGSAVFAEDHDEMVIVRDIDIFSLCEHHLVPFTGKVRFRRDDLAAGWPLTAGWTKTHRCTLATSPTSLYSASPSSRASQRRSRVGCKYKSASPSRSPQPSTRLSVLSASLL